MNAKKQAQRRRARTRKLIAHLEEIIAWNTRRTAELLRENDRLRFKVYGLPDPALSGSPAQGISDT